MKKNLVNIDLGARSYDIHIGSGIFEKAADYLPFDVQGKKIYIVTDTNVSEYAEGLKHTLLKAGAGFCECLTLPFGEKTKSYDRLVECHNWMLKNNIQRNSYVFAVGGGVIGDLAGFAASSILRGVPFVQVPTTLLSQVDSSVGGKTGINTRYGKNLVGAFYQPVSVITDLDTLKTLPKRELLAGYAEVVKYGLIWDLPFFEWLEKNGHKVIDLDEEALIHATRVSCEAKAAVVQADEREGGRRALLNLGHTFGHALEAAAGYDGTLLHGEGVSIGTVMAFELSVKMGLCSQEDSQRVRDHFEHIGLPICVSGINTDVESLVATMKRDKKVLDNKMTFILVRNIGEAFVTQDVDEALVREVLCDFLSGKVL